MASKGRQTKEQAEKEELSAKEKGELIEFGKNLLRDENEKLKEKLSLSPWIFEMAGKIKSMMFTEIQARCFKVLFLKKVKESKNYREIYGMTWEQFCEHIHISWRTADQWLKELEPLTLEFSANFADFSGYDFNKIRYLARGVSANLADFTDHSIIYQGEEIPLIPENKDQIQALLEKIEETFEKKELILKKEIEDKDGDLRAKDRVLKDKEENIQKLHRDLSRLTKIAEKKGLTPEEDAFLSKMDNLRMMFDGSYLVHLEKANVKEFLHDEDGKLAIPRMRAAYIATLRYFQLQINKLYNDAIADYGDPGMLPEKAWHPGVTLS